MARKRTRLAAAVCGVAALAVVAGLGQATSTDASWSRKPKVQASVGTMTVSAPTITSCKASNVVLVGSTVKLTWTLPSGTGSDGSAYSESDAEYGLAKASSASLLGLELGSNLTTTGPSGSDDHYTTTYTIGVLASTLGLGGGPYQVGIRVDDPSGWDSAYSIETVTVPAVLGTGTCDPAPPVTGS